MFTRKQLITIFGNCTYLISKKLKLKPILIELCEETQSQLFIFENHMDMLFCLYLDGVDYESIVLTVFRVNEDTVNSYTFENVVGTNIEKRVPMVRLYTDSMPFTSYDSEKFSIDDIFYLGNDKYILKLCSNLKNIVKHKKYYTKIFESIQFIDGTIDIKIIQEV